MSDIDPIKGLIELTDDFTSPLGLAEAALGNFTKKNQESLIAVAGAAGIVTAALGAVAVATIELGKHGAEVNDVNATLEHFAGGANAAKAAMDALRAGTLNTVDDFTLAKNAAELLSANVKLTAEDFGTLGSAAAILSNRGLGSTQEQLELVNNALTTGSTRALAAKVGVVAIDDAQEAFAKTLGITAAQLTNVGKAEANRIEVMRILKEAVKDAGDQERDFGEQFESAQAQITNYIDELSSAVASSKVFAAGFDALGDALSGAFDGEKEESIETIVGLVEDASIVALDFAQTVIVMAKTVEGAWNAVRTVVLGTETVIVGVIDAILEGVTLVAEAGSKLHIIDPEVTAELETARTVLRGMTVDLAEQTLAAGKAVVGHTEFDTTLDKLSGTLSTIQGAMIVARDATTQQTAAANDSTIAAKKHAESQEELNKKFIDQAKIEAELTKSTKELSAIWDDYYKLVAQASGTTRDQQEADIESTFKAQVAALDKLDPLYKEKYELYKKIAHESLEQVNVDWNGVRDKSIEGLRDMADEALATYNAMISSGLHFTQEVLQDQKDKYLDLRDKANAWAVTTTKAVDDTTKQVQLLDSAWDAVGLAVDDNAVKVKMLNGEIVTVAEALKRLNTGGSADVTSANFDQSIRSIETAGGYNPASFGVQQYQDPYKLAKQGYSFAEVVQYAYSPSTGRIPPPKGPRIPGFAEGGVAMVGENGPELVRLPLGSTVYPNSSRDQWGGGASNIELNFHVNGTAEESAHKIKKIIMNELKRVRQFGPG